VITGNTFNTGGNWGGGEAIIRLQAGPVFSGNASDYWAPTNWFNLDNGDTDLGGCGAVLIDVANATPSQLVLALGKDGNGYLLNRNNLGGIRSAVASANVDGVIRGQSAATYRTTQGTYFVFRVGSSAVSAYKITATSPPSIVPAWSVSQSGQGSPWVTTTDGTNNAIVWVVGSESGGDQRLHGYNGDTGAVVYAGGGANELMSNTRKWNPGIVARGRIYFAASNKVYAFTVPMPTPTPTPTPTPIPTPAPPSGLTATPGACLKINLSWTDNSTNEDGFKIERSGDNITFTQIATVPANTTTYTAQQTQAGLRYFRVRAYNINGNSPYSNSASSYSGVCPTPRSPTNLTATAVSSSQINLSWTDNSNNETGFKVERSTDGTTFTQIATVGANVAMYVNIGLPPLTKYYYRVRAYNTGGNSAYSNIASAKTRN
jgi:hypothetical protein